MPAADRLIIALAQISPIVGDVDGNLALGQLRGAARPPPSARISRSRGIVPVGSARDLELEAPAFSGGLPHRLRELARETADRRPGRARRAPLGQDGALYNAAVPCSTADVSRPSRSESTAEPTAHLTRSGCLGLADPGPVLFKGRAHRARLSAQHCGPNPVECITETVPRNLLVPNASPYSAR